LAHSALLCGARQVLFPLTQIGVELEQLLGIWQEPLDVAQ
jgi:hypothetical protein